MFRRGPVSGFAAGRFEHPDGETGFLENGAARIQSIQHDFEYEKDCGEGYDRASLRLGVRQRELLREIKALGKPLVAVLIMGRPLIINEVLDQADAVLLAWYPGMMGGQAVAEALFGDYNPGGKLPVSFPLDEGQLPVYYNARRARPNYIDLPAAPRLSFGFGLSYTTFAYSASARFNRAWQRGHLHQLQSSIGTSPNTSPTAVAPALAPRPSK